MRLALGGYEIGSRWRGDELKRSESEQRDYSTRSGPNHEQENSSGLLVTDGGKVLGLVTDRRLLNYFFALNKNRKRLGCAK
jgi:hypothetical protein